ncbi:MAG TPA: hypothetical protein VJB65_04940, partial [Patescibacteria group bacterium]|nr:hypothetical protein [Patescibacteria group bacterium]
MRIGIDCRSLQEPYPTGVSVYTRELLRALFALPESAAHEFRLFLADGGNKTPSYELQSSIFNEQSHVQL